MWCTEKGHARACAPCSGSAAAAAPRGSRTPAWRASRVPPPQHPRRPGVARRVHVQSAAAS
eukprot:1298017-Prymnesium_polylepis.1